MANEEPAVRCEADSPDGVGAAEVQEDSREARQRGKA